MRPKADNPSSPSTTTYTFDEPTPATGWAFVLGDIDADQVQVAATDGSGAPVSATQINQWFQGVFNYAGDADVPTWNAGTSTLVGNVGANDTNGASGWFEPNVSLSEITFTYTERSGFPVYQTWFAGLARTISGTVTVPAGQPACPVDQSVVHLIGPAGNELATTQPNGGAYSFGQYATQPGYEVSIDPPANCAVIGVETQPASTATADAIVPFQVGGIVPQAVSGTVTVAGTSTPVADVAITLTPPGGPPEVTTTDSEGQYLFDNNVDNLSGYVVTVTATPAGFTAVAPSSQTFAIGGTAVVENFTLNEQPSLSGTITGGGGPLGGVTVALTPIGGGTPITTVTRGDGTYLVDHLASGNYDIAVTPPDGYNPVAPLIGVAVAGSDVTGQDFDLSRPGSLGGQVSDVSDPSNPLPLANTAVVATGPGGTRDVQTGADGQYFIDGLDPGDYTVNLTVPPSTSPVGATTLMTIITSAGEIRGGLDFTIQQAAPTATSPPATPVTPAAPVTPAPPATPVAGATSPTVAGSGSGNERLAVTGAPLWDQGAAAAALAGSGMVLLFFGRLPRRFRARPLRRCP